MSQPGSLACLPSPVPHFSAPVMSAPAAALHTFVLARAVQLLDALAQSQAECAMQADTIRTQTAKIAEQAETIETLSGATHAFSGDSTAWVDAASAAPLHSLPAQASQASHPLAVIDAEFALDSRPRFVARRAALTADPPVSFLSATPPFDADPPPGAPVEPLLAPRVFMYARTSRVSNGAPKQFDLMLATRVHLNAGIVARNQTIANQNAAAIAQAMAAGAPPPPPLAGLPQLPMDARFLAAPAPPVYPHAPLATAAAHAAGEYGDSPYLAHVGRPLGPELVAVCRALQPGDTVCVWSVSRLHHDREQLDWLFRFFAKWGIRLCVMFDSIDTGLSFAAHGGNPRPTHSFYFHAGMTHACSISKAEFMRYDSARSNYYPNPNWLPPPAYWTSAAGPTKWMD